MHQHTWKQWKYCFPLCQIYKTHYHFQLNIQHTLGKWHQTPQGNPLQILELRCRNWLHNPTYFIKAFEFNIMVSMRKIYSYNRKYANIIWLYSYSLVVEHWYVAGFFRWDCVNISGHRPTMWDGWYLSTFQQSTIPRLNANNETTSDLLMGDKVQFMRDEVSNSRSCSLHLMFESSASVPLAQLLEIITDKCRSDDIVYYQRQI